jgi:hypothetical protein
MKIHPELKEKHKCAKECPKGCSKDHECVSFVGCGPKICEQPCENCLCWSGYGGSEVVEQLKSL